MAASEREYFNALIATYQTLLDMGRITETEFQNKLSDIARDMTGMD